MADVSDISCFLSMFHEPHAGLIQAARQLLSGERAPLRQKLLADLLHTVSENSGAETRAEDPPWFEGALWLWGSREPGVGGSSELDTQGRPDSTSVPRRGLPRRGLPDEALA